jgi:predicted phosphohydrolase
MALYTISDLHLSLSSDKPMTVFRGWENYTERIESNWRRIIKNEDTVILPGDFSWGLKLSETLNDFKFLDSLPGKKILLKGNHDLWWSTVKKVNEFFSENNITSVELLFNNAYKIGERVICGTRGWFYDQSEDDKIRKREVGRLRLSFEAAEKLGGEKIVFLHYPPVYGDYVANDIISVLKQFNIKTVYHGHIHGSGFNNSVSEYDGINFKLISADCIDFTPFLIV